MMLLDSSTLRVNRKSRYRPLNPGANVIMPSMILSIKRCRNETHDGTATDVKTVVMQEFVKGREGRDSSWVVINGLAPVVSL